MQPVNNQASSHYIKMTQTPLVPLLISLSIPTMISMLVTNIYNMADTAFVGRLGTSASGAIGIVFGFMAIIQAFGFLFGQGSGSLIARLLGKKDYETASVIASTGFFCVLTFGILLEVFGFLFLDPLVRILGSTETIAPYAKTYVSFILVSAPFMASSFTLNNILRYEGKAALGMIGLLTGAVLNMAGDPILMFGLNLGIAGAGLSTCISQIISFGILLSMFLRGKSSTKISRRYLSPKPEILSEICTTGLPSLLRQILNTFATILLNQCAGVYGDAAIAAMSIVSRVSFFTFSVSLGIGQGYQPISGFNYGAGKYSRVRKGFRVTAILSEIILVLLTSVVLFNVSNVVGIFRDDPLVIEIGTRALTLQCLANLILPFSVVTEMQMQSTGKKVAAALLSSVKSGLFFIPLLLILTHFRGLSGIQEAQPLANALSVFPSLIFAVWFFQNLPKEDL